MLVVFGALLVVVGAVVVGRPGLLWNVSSRLRRTQRRPLALALAAARIVGVIVAFVGLAMLILGVTG